MKILFFGKSKRRTRTTGYIVKGFRQRGHQVKWINYARRKRILGRRLASCSILSAFKRMKPDFVFVFSGDIPISILEVIAPETKTAMLYLEPDIRESHIPKARLVDYFFVTNRSQLDEYGRLGVRNPTSIFQACDPDEHRKVSAKTGKWASEVAFIGKPANEERLSVVKSVAAEHDLSVWGSNEWEEKGFEVRKQHVHPNDFATICASSKIILGCDRATGLKSYFSNRTWITLGCGGFLLTNYQPALEELFENKKHLVWYRDSKECLELIKYYLENEDERQAIADNGYKLAHESHTYNHFADAVFSTVFGDGSG